MCIICDNKDIGYEYMVAIDGARRLMREAEKHLLSLSDIRNIKHKPTKEKAKHYNMAHKRLVKIRRMIAGVESLRSGNAV